MTRPAPTSIALAHLNALHARLCRDAEWEAEDSYFWLRAHLVLVAAARFVTDSPLPYSTLLALCPPDYQAALAFTTDHPDRFLTADDVAEWMLKAGEIRLVLHSGWGGVWDAEGTRAAYRAFEDDLRGRFTAAVHAAVDDFTQPPPRAPRTSPSPRGRSPRGRSPRGRSRRPMRQATPSG